MNCHQPCKVSEDVDLPLDECLSERRDHELAISANLLPDESDADLGRGAGHFRFRKEGLTLGREGGDGAVGVAGGVDAQPRPRQQVVDALQREGGVGGGATDHQVRGPASYWSLQYS